jgi:transcriptional regulator with XRE-family HTH domain
LAKKRSRNIQPLAGTEKAFGQALREVRKNRKISQEDLGLEADFDRTFVSLIERGIQSPTIRTVVRLASVLQVRPSIIVRKMERILEAASKEPPRAIKKREGKNK